MQIIEPVRSAGHEQRVEAVETIPCYPIILRRNDSEVLLLKNDGHSSLPRIEIPRWQRMAPNLIPAIAQQLGVDAICRFSHGAGERYVIVDALSPATSDTAWVPVNDIRWSDNKSTIARDSFYEALRQAAAYQSAEPPVPFSRPGWFDEVTDWVAAHLSLRKVTLNGSWLQYNTGPWFSLLRFETSALPVWFKAVGAPNLREYEITLELAKLHSQHVPQLLATEQKWNAWLMLDAAGQPLDERASLNCWKTAARSLAELQTRSITASEVLLAAGCEDLRAAVLLRQIEPFLDGIEQLMGMQPSTPPRILPRADLRFIGMHLRYAIDELHSLGIPDTIGHSDLNPGNVLIARNSAVFLDWMEGSISHPLLAFEYLSALLNRLRPGYETWQRDLSRSYCEVWKDVCSEVQMSRALKLTPLIAPFALAVSMRGWDGDIRSISPNLQKLIRSLARRMFAAAHRIANSAST